MDYYANMLLEPFTFATAEYSPCFHTGVVSALFTSSF